MDEPLSEYTGDDERYILQFKAATGFTVVLEFGRLETLAENRFERWPAWSTRMQGCVSLARGPLTIGLTVSTFDMHTSQTADNLI